MGHSFDQIRLRAGCDGPANVLVPLICRKHNHRALRAFRPNRRDRLNAAHIRHSQIHQDHIRRVLQRERDCLSSGSGLSHDHHVRLPTDDTQEPDTHHRVVIGDQHPDDAGLVSRIVIWNAHLVPGRQAKGIVHYKAGARTCNVNGHIR